MNAKISVKTYIEKCKSASWQDTGDNMAPSQCVSSQVMKVTQLFWSQTPEVYTACVLVILLNGYEAKDTKIPQSL